MSEWSSLEQEIADSKAYNKQLLSKYVHLKEAYEKLEKQQNGSKKATSKFKALQAKYDQVVHERDCLRSDLEVMFAMESSLNEKITQHQGQIATLRCLNEQLMKREANYKKMQKEGHMVITTAAISQAIMETDYYDTREKLIAARERIKELEKQIK